MSIKRELQESLDEDSSEQCSKRQKKQNKTRQHQNAGIDPTWGQKYVFLEIGQATTIPDGQESEFEDDADAMAYLMSVRQEASGIPHLLVAPKPQIGPQLPAHLQEDTVEEGGWEVADPDPADRSICESGEGDARGWYQDGAYIARPDETVDVAVTDSNASGDDQVSSKMIQQAYFENEMLQFRRLRRMLRSSPPSNVASSLTPDKLTYAEPFGPSSQTSKLWSRLLRTTDPDPVQIALMDKDSILRILRVLSGGKCLSQGYPITERTSRWLYALFARLPDKGRLTHVEISWIRDIGKKAVLLSRSLAEMAALREEMEDGELGIINEEALGETSDQDTAVASEEGAGQQKAGLSESSLDTSADVVLKKVEAANETEEAEDGEIDENEGDDVAMELASQSSVGEVEKSGLEEAKKRLLAHLNSGEDDLDAEMSDVNGRSRRNARATLTMIMTVAGEFYGQRDLLEFREPFVGL